MDENLMGLLESGAVKAARGLVGWRFFVREQDGSLTGGILTETEAYTQEDAASHSYNGRTMRNDIMFGPAGHIYVYFTYGMHWCANIVTGKEGDGEAVLLRALEPTEGLARMRGRRAGRPDHQLANGPAKLCQALSITKTHSGMAADGSRFLLLPPEHPYQVLATARIGITRDTHRLWRFVAK